MNNILYYSDIHHWKVNCSKNNRKNERLRETREEGQKSKIPYFTSDATVVV